MPKRPLTDPLTDSLTTLSDDRRAEALRRFNILRPHLIEDVPLADMARMSGVPLRSLQSGLTAGNFRLLQRLFMQIERIARINEIAAITEDVVEAAAQTLVIGNVN